MSVLTKGCYAFSVANLLLLTLILWAGKRYDHRNTIFGFYILLFTIPLFLNLAVITDLLPLRYYFLCLFPALLLGPTAYTLCQMFLQIPVPAKRILLEHYLPAVFCALSLSLLTILTQEKWLDDQSFFFKGHGIPDFFRYIIFIHACGYHVYCWRISGNRSKNDKGSSEIMQKRIFWIYDFFRNMLLLGMLFGFLHSIRFLILGNTEVGSSVISPLVILLSYIMIVYKSISSIPLFTDSSMQEYKRKRSGENQLIVTSDEKRRTLIEYKLQEALGREKLFKNKELSLNTLAGYLKLHPKIVSQFINQHHGVHFSDFINKYRVEESIQMMQNPVMSNLKLEAIAEASGFKSRASFYSIFKKQTGYTPAMFRKEHSEQGNCSELTNSFEKTAS